MSSHENEDDVPSTQTTQDEEVQPSSMLIDILHHKLRDPSIVRKFEDSRQDSSTYGLICPRWVLQHAKSYVINDKEGKLDGTDNIKLPNSNREAIYNSYPKRSYIDLRMEQNRMFANDQCNQCKVLLSKLSQPSTASQSTPSSNNNNDNSNNKQWKKQADTIQSLLNEGLTSCPNHVGLLQAEKEYKEWIQQRINILSTPSLPTKQTTAAIGKTTPSNSTLLPNSYAYSNMKKGAENRAQAALRDAQLERSFMLGGNAKDDEKDDKNMYPLLSAHDDQQQDINGGCKKEESLSSESDTDEDSRRRKKSKHKYKKLKRSKSRHGHHDDRRRRRRKRSSSESRSHSRSRSRLSSSSQSSDSYRRRKHRRKERKRRKKKKKSRRYRESRSTRYSSEEDDDNEVDTGMDTGKSVDDEKQVERST